MKQGDIYLYAFQPPDKRRPVLILTRSSAIRKLTGVTVAPITSTIRDIPTQVFLSSADGSLNDCAENCDNNQTIQKAGLQKFITHLSPSKLRDVRAAIQFALGFDSM